MSLLEGNESPVTLPGQGGLSSMAGCEPQPSLSDQINQDLNIKGQLSVPQMLDMEAIRIVYPLTTSPPCTKFYKYGDAINLGGTASYTFRIFDMTDVSTKRRYATIDYFSIMTKVDAAGRAALAAVFDEVQFQLRTKKNGAATSIYPALGRGSYPAAAGYPGWHMFSSIVHSQYRARNDEIIELDLRAMPSLAGWRLNYDEGLECIINLSSLGNFPANTSLMVTSGVTVYGIMQATEINTTPLT